MNGCQLVRDLKHAWVAYFFKLFWNEKPAKIRSEHSNAVIKYFVSPFFAVRIYIVPILSYLLFYQSVEPTWKENEMMSCTIHREQVARRLDDLSLFFRIKISCSPPHRKVTSFTLPIALLNSQTKMTVFRLPIHIRVFSSWITSIKVWLHFKRTEKCDSALLPKHTRRKKKKIFFVLRRLRR